MMAEQEQSYEDEALSLARHAVNRLAHEEAMENLGLAQVLATLALVQVQREATEWGKTMIAEIRQQQEQLISDIRAELAKQ